MESAAPETLEEKLQTIAELGRSRRPQDAARLIDFLGDPKWLVRKQAAAALAAFGPVVIEPLARVLASGNEDQRFWAVKALVALGQQALPLLLRALEKGSKPMRVYAAGALGEIGDDAAIPVLVRALGDPVWRVRRNSYSALLVFGERALPALQRVMFEENEDIVFWAAKALGKLGEPAREVLLTALKTGSEQLKFIVAAALAETGDTRVIAVLVKNCGDKNWIVQKRSAEALGEIGAKAIPAIAEALRNARHRHRYWLLYALVRMGDPGKRALGRMLVQGGESFRWNVKEHLQEIGEAILPVLSGLACHEDKNVRFYAVTCVAELSQAAEAADTLMAALSDSSWSIRKISANSLASRGEAVTDRLNLALETGDEDLRYWVTYIFGKMGRTGLPYLIKALGDSNKNIAYFAASALGDVQDEEVVRPLIAALGDESWPVRRNAADSLKRLARFSVSRLVNHINDENEDIQYWALRVLTEVGAEYLDDIIHKLKKGSDEERFMAAKALGAIGDPRAADALVAALKDGHEWVRLYSAIALGNMGDKRALEHLMIMLGDAGFKLSPGIRDVFRRFGKDAVGPLMQAAVDESSVRRRSSAIRVLGFLKADEVLELVLKGLYTGETSERLACIEAAANFGRRPEIIQALTAVLESGESQRIRGRVIQSLGEIGTGDVVPALLSALHNGRTGREGEEGVLQVLRNLRGKAVDALLSFLSHKKVGLRKSAARVLVAIGPAIRSSVEKLAESEDANTRFWAGKVLRGLDGEVEI